MNRRLSFAAAPSTRLHLRGEFEFLCHSPDGAFGGRRLVSEDERQNRPLS
jgi:hypothetical protein